MYELCPKIREKTVPDQLIVNHKPGLSTGSRTTKLISGSKNGLLKMVDIDGDKRSKYTYSGPRRDSKNSYVLIFDQTKQTCTLEHLSSSFDLNLESTPVEQSASKLQERYPYIPSLTEPTEDQSNTFDDDAEPDPDNPFDYRHFLKVSLKEHPPSVLSRSPSPLPQSQNTPRLNSSQYMSPQALVEEETANVRGLMEDAL